MQALLRIPDALSDAYLAKGFADDALNDNPDHTNADTDGTVPISNTSLDIYILIDFELNFKTVINNDPTKIVLHEEAL